MDSICKADTLLSGGADAAQPPVDGASDAQPPVDGAGAAQPPVDGAGAAPHGVAEIDG